MILDPQRQLRAPRLPDREAAPPERQVGPGLGLELVSCVNGIPKGSRLAVSTNLLEASLRSLGDELERRRAYTYLAAACLKLGCTNRLPGLRARWQQEFTNALPQLLR